MSPAHLGTIVATAALLSAMAPPAPAQSLDYEVFKSRVEPIFLAKRAGHVRCVVCHSERSNNGFKLEKLSPGAKSWSEEQSRRNFEVVSRLVAPGDPAKSLLLLHPLAPEAGGDAYHTGGRQFATKDDPDWKTIARWVGGPAR
ncbi:MAG TPA: hypothetical protein VJO54_17075 [Burkholderiales bacterium]|jgi:hypothetical protein|nr:hypothetical protein [Burkholderiales bacterium]